MHILAQIWTEVYNIRSKEIKRAMVELVRVTEMGEELKHSTSSKAFVNSGPR